MFSEENRITNNKLISENNMVSTFAVSANEDVRLKTEYNTPPSFVKIYEGSTFFYGGDQYWWSSSSKQSNGCCVVAAANITSYLAIYDASIYSNMYKLTLSKSDFIKHMDSLYTAINPPLFGEFMVSAWAQKVSDWAKQKGVTLNPVWKNWSFTLDNCSNYIKEGLNKNKPVGCTNLNKFGDTKPWHYMTITKYFRDSTTDDRWIAVSNFSKRESINLKSYYNSMTGITSLGGAFVYFE